MASSSIIEPIRCPITPIDTRGDVTLIVSQEEENSPCRGFVVCSRTLARSSRYFATLLYGPFREAKGRFSPKWMIRLLGDDPDAFKLLLDITHGKNKDLPNILDETAITKAIVLADKYLITDQLRTYAHHWIGPLKKARELRIHEIVRSLGKEGAIYSDYHKQAIVIPDFRLHPDEIRSSVKFGQCIGSHSTVWFGLFFYAWYCGINDEELVFQYLRIPNHNHSHYTKSDEFRYAHVEPMEYTNNLADELDFLPNVYIDAVADLRRRVVSYILRTTIQSFHQYFDKFTCYRDKDKRNKCNRRTGALIAALQDGLGMPNSSKVEDSQVRPVDLSALIRQTLDKGELLLLDSKFQGWGSVGSIIEFEYIWSRWPLPGADHWGDVYKDLNKQALKLSADVQVVSRRES